MKLNSVFLGNMHYYSENVPVAGMPSTVAVRYTVGKYGMDDGGNLKIVRKGFTDWQEPQFDDASALGFSTAKTNGNVKLIVEKSEWPRPFDNAIKIKVSGGNLKEGDTITLTLGDRSGGGAGILTQTIAEKNHRILAFVDPFGTNKFEPVPSNGSFSVESGVCGALNITLPSMSEIDAEFSVKISLTDDYRNRCGSFRGVVRLVCGEGFECSETIIELRAEDNGHKTVPAKITKPGVYYVTGEVDGLALRAQSNALKSVAHGSDKIFWGDMHGQNDLTCGLGSLAEYFSYARDVGALDFTGWQGNDFEVSDAAFEAVKEAVKSYNSKDFIIFLGYEWSGVTAYGGDHNVFFLGTDESIYRTSQWLVPQTDDGSSCYPITALHERFKNRTDVMLVPHVGGRHANLNFFNGELSSVIEIHSHHGVFDWFLEEAVKRKIKVGFIASSDDIYSQMGNSGPVGTNGQENKEFFHMPGGLTAVYTNDFTRQGIWDALKKRACYATTNARIILDFKVNGHTMGQEIVADGFSSEPEINVSVEGTAPIDYIELYRNTDLLERVYPSPSPSPVPEIRNKRVKILWAGANSRYRAKPVNWSGSIFVKNGCIVNAENYAKKRFTDGIVNYNSQIVNFKSKTSGNFDGVILDLIPEGDCQIQFCGKGVNVEVDVDKLKLERTEFFLGDVDRKLCFSLESDGQGFHMSYFCKDSSVATGLNAYYVKVFQKDGNRAWSSPVFVNRKKI